MPSHVPLTLFAPEQVPGTCTTYLPGARQVTVPPLKVPLTPCRELDASRAAVR